MHKNVIIYNELKGLNSPLADISNQNVFTVPEGYFDSFPTDVLFLMQNKLSGSNDSNTPFSKMNVPEGYFDNLADDILNKIKKSEVEFLVDPALPDFFSRQIIFTVPQNYFETLSNDIQAKIRLEETFQESTLLLSLRTHNIFTVPAGYFEGLPADVFSKVSVQPARIITMKPRSSIFRYAIAAAVSGIIGLGIFSTLDKNNTTLTNDPAIAAIIHPPASVPLMAVAKTILTNNSFDKEMESLNEDEIVNYLKNDGEDINAALVASVTDEKTLPNSDEYFTDEQALDNFLNEQHIVQTSNN